MRILAPLLLAFKSTGCATGTNIRKFTFTSANGGVGSRVNLSVLVEPFNVMVCRFPLLSLIGTHPKDAQPVVGTANVPMKLVVCGVVPHPLVTIERRAWDWLASPHANRPQTSYVPPG